MFNKIIIIQIEQNTIRALNTYYNFGNTVYKIQ